jgi:hypothetical protein
MAQVASIALKTGKLTNVETSEHLKGNVRRLKLDGTKVIRTGDRNRDAVWSNSR